MKFRRIAGSMLVAALTLAPTLGQAEGEFDRKPIVGTVCTVGDASLAFSEDGVWEGRTNVKCISSDGITPKIYAGVGGSFAVVLVQGATTFPEVGVTGSVVFTSYDDLARSTSYGCLNCAAIQPYGFKFSLAPGLYALKSQGVVKQVTPGGEITRRGAQTTCFLVTSDAVDGVRKVPCI